MSRCIIIITTYQTPHLEDLLNFEKLRTGFDEYIYVNLVPNLFFRNDLTPRRTVPFRLTLSRIFWNFAVKEVMLRLSGALGKLRHYRTKDFVDIVPSHILSYDDAYRIAQSFYVNETQASGFNACQDERISLDKNAVIIEKFIHKLNDDLALSNDDTVAIFNGRLPNEAMSLALLRAYVPDLNVIYLEVNQFDNYAVVLDYPIHDLAEYDGEIRRFARENNPAILKDECDLIIENQRRNWLSKQAEAGDLAPQNSVDMPVQVVFFTSSLDEYAFYYEQPINQVSMAIALNELFKTLGVVFKVRVHPNTASKSMGSQRYWTLLKKYYPDMVLNFDEDVSSYKLVADSKFTISVGSSLAAQSVLLGCPHMLLGNQSYYDKLDGFIKTSADDYLAEAEALITSPQRYEKALVDIRDESVLNLVRASLLFERHYGLPHTFPLWGKTFNVLSDKSYNYQLNFVDYDAQSLSLTDDDKALLTFILMANQIIDNLTKPEDLVLSHQPPPYSHHFAGTVNKDGLDGERPALAHDKAYSMTSNALIMIPLAGREGHSIFISRTMVDDISKNLTKIDLSDFQSCPPIQELINGFTYPAFPDASPMDKLALSALSYLQKRQALPKKLQVNDFCHSPHLFYNQQAGVINRAPR